MTKNVSKRGQLKQRKRRVLIHHLTKKHKELVCLLKKWLRAVSKGRQRRGCIYGSVTDSDRGGHDLYSGPRHPEFMHRYDFMKAHVFACALPE